ncbi:MAG: hypothetical protein AB1591_06705, partial [Pseudomonadota bacterium]
RGRIPNRRAITERPLSLESRRRIGHWEGDTLIGKGRRQAIVSPVERKSGFCLLAHVTRKTSQAVTFATTPTSALSGGSNRATALFQNASPYRAIFLPYRPQVQDHIGATTILTRGALYLIAWIAASLRPSQWRRSCRRVLILPCPVYPSALNQ